MEEKRNIKKVRKYIGASGLRRFFCCLFAALTLLSLLPMLKKDKVENAVSFDPVYSSVFNYVYLDAVGVSDWAYRQYDEYDPSDFVTFNFAEDAEGYLYTVFFDEITPEKMGMSEQREYWDRESKDAAQPEPVRIYGTVSRFTAKERKDFAEYWGISKEEFRDYFGKKYMRVGDTTWDTYGGIWIVAALILGVITMVVFEGAGKIKKNRKKCLSALSGDNVAYEFEAPTTASINDDRGRASAHYLYGRHTGTVLKYEDILWCYIFPDSGKAKSAAYLTAYTASDKLTAVKLKRSADDESFGNIISIITQHNPDVLVGYTPDNMRAYAERCKTWSVEKAYRNANV